MHAHMYVQYVVCSLWSSLYHTHQSPSPGNIKFYSLMLKASSNIVTKIVVVMRGRKSCLVSTDWFLCSFQVLYYCTLLDSCSGSIFP